MYCRTGRNVSTSGGSGKDPTEGDRSRLFTGNVKSCRFGAVDELIERRLETGIEEHSVLVIPNLGVGHTIKSGTDDQSLCLFNMIIVGHTRMTESTMAHSCRNGDNTFPMKKDVKEKNFSPDR